MAYSTKNQNQPRYKASLLIFGVTVLGGLSLTVLQADAQSAFAPHMVEPNSTPVVLTIGYSAPSQHAPTFVGGSVLTTQPRAQMASAMPRFDMAEAAGRYASLVREADRMANLPALSASAIDQALVTTSKVSGKGISEGAGAYAAQIAAGNSEFAAGLRTTVNLLGRDVVLARLKSDPDAFLAMIAGSAQAARAASGALRASETKLAQAEQVLGAAAYSVQTQSWSQRVVDTSATLAAHRSAALLPLDPDQFTTTGLDAPASDAPINGRYLLAASYQILGDNVAAAAVLDKPLGRMCMNRVQLNVRQCIAASQYPYEHLFCLSRHSFGETLGCVKDAVK